MTSHDAYLGDLFGLFLKSIDEFESSLCFLFVANKYVDTKRTSPQNK